MTSFDEAYAAAANWLGERELLLNSQLLQLTAGDEALRAEVRACLLSDGVARDRYGVGLVRGERPLGERLASHRRQDDVELDDSDSSEVTFAEAPGFTRHEDAPTASADSDADINADEPIEADWWLMKGGATHGPFPFETLRRMRQRGDVADTHLVRQGERGLWCGPHDVEGLVETVEAASANRTANSDHAKAHQPHSHTPNVQSHTSAPLARSPRAETTLTPLERRRASKDEAAQQRVSSPIIESARHAATGDIYTQTPAPETAADSEIDDGWEFFLWEGGRPVGPVSKADLCERLAKHLLLEDEFVQVGVDGEWQPVSKALNMRRSLLATGPKNKGLDPSTHTAPQLRTDPRRSDATGSTAEPARATTRKPPKPVVNVASPIDAITNVGRAWQHTAVFVGGASRLQGIVAALVALLALLVWLRQPPAVSTIYREFAQYHTKLTELRAKRTGPTDWKQATARDHQRVQSLLDSLKQRASAARPIEQQLLWAGRYGLIELFKRPVDAADFERHFATHMSRAKRMLDGGTATLPSSDTLSAPRPVDTPDASATTPVDTRTTPTEESK